MRRNRWTVGSMAALAIAAICATAGLVAQEPKLELVGVLDGETALVETRDGRLTLLDRVMPGKFAGRDYILGRAEQSELLDSDPFDRSTIWILLDDVSRIGAFKSRNDANEAIHAYHTRNQMRSMEDARRRRSVAADVERREVQRRQDDERRRQEAEKEQRERERKERGVNAKERSPMK